MVLKQEFNIKIIRWFLSILLFHVLGLTGNLWAIEKKTPELMPGDVILLSLNCYLCKAISLTTDSPFNHSGLVTRVTTDGVFVAQALGASEELSLQRFLAQSPRGARIKVKRANELIELGDKAPNALKQRSARLFRHFKARFIGLPFDRNFLWDNFEAGGRELMYCSELVNKTLSQILTKPLQTEILDYSRLNDFWSAYFQGPLPIGIIGNSPALLDRDPLLIDIWQGTTSDINP